MTTNEIIETLVAHNAWRRDLEEMEMPDPTKVGQAIDQAIGILSNLPFQGVKALQELCHADSIKAGWWPQLEPGGPGLDPLDVPSKLALIHSEISEAMEGHRKGLTDDKLPHRAMFEVELADAVIRIMDLAGATGCDLAGAIEEKLAYNRTRPDHKPENRAAEGGKKY